jgi:cytochrome c
MKFRARSPGLILSIGAFLAVSSTVAASSPTCLADIELHLTDQSYDGQLKLLKISCQARTDVEGGLLQPNHNTVQRAANIFSWEAFLALNWPAGTNRGEPDPKASITGSGPRVWETWKEVFEVYLPRGRAPHHWNEPEPSSECGDKVKHLLRTDKTGNHGLDSTIQALASDGTLPVTLKDQQGRWLFYETRLNQTLFDYIAHPKSSLYNGAEQAKATEIEFPVGSQLIKAAWRRVDKDAEKFFYVTKACVCEDDSCQTMTMGLAGFHIMTKTESAPQWIWSTFEHVDNVRSTHGTVYPLNNNQDCSRDNQDCLANQQTADFRDSKPFARKGFPNQVRRMVPISPQVAQLNRYVQDHLRGLPSELQYYQLVGTQWPSPSSSPVTSTVFKVEPAYLANTTMETFGQKTSSCMGCHAMARTLSPSGFVSADFSFTLNNALPKPQGALCVEVGGSESCSDSIIPTPPPSAPPQAVSKEILDGYDFTTRTYEEAESRENVGSQLHCSSCHLNAGGNRNAAWWVDMQKVYEYPETTHLQDRINQCFKRSMNGDAICSTAEGPKDCDDNPVMSSLIAYMGWITEQYYARSPNCQPPHGFPPFSYDGGKADEIRVRGKAIYAQKCSFCHKADGQGRYESGEYFRPALWGPLSFNACAGMAKPKTLGAFLRWNMPYTSGGMLTIREARDLAAYIDDQCRPGKEGCSLTPDCVNGKPK